MLKLILNYFSPNVQLKIYINDHHNEQLITQAILSDLSLLGYKFEREKTGTWLKYFQQNFARKCLFYWLNNLHLFQG